MSFMISPLRCACVSALLAVSAACSSLLPSPETIAVQQAKQSLQKAVQEQAQTLAQSAGKQVAQRVIAFTNTDGIVGHDDAGWPLMQIEAVAAQRPPQLILEGPLRGVVILDDQEMGLVQPDSVRIVTLAPGEHQIRIEHPTAPTMTAQFYIDTGERMTLRWNPD